MNAFLNSILGAMITVTAILVTLRCIFILINEHNNDEISLSSALKKCKRVVIAGILILCMEAFVTYVKLKYL